MKLQTLRCRGDFLKVSKSTLKVVMPCFILQVRLNTCANVSPVSDFPVRFGFVVSRKIGNSVERNFVKRRFRYLCVLHRELFVWSYDYVVVARYQKDKISYKNLEGQFVGSLKRIESLVPVSSFSPEELTLK